MCKRRLAAVLAGLFAYCGTIAAAQEKPAAPESKVAVERAGAEYSGMYSFLKEGEFVQVTVEDAGRVTGFVSRYGDLESDKGVFLDQFFKTGKLDGNRLAFITEVVHGTAYEFKGTVERGEGRKPGDEAYYLIKGTLTERVTDVNQKSSSKSREVTFKAFPSEASTEPANRK
jgi:hypothetical protein